MNQYSQILQFLPGLSISLFLTCNVAILLEFITRGWRVHARTVLAAGAVWILLAQLILGHMTGTWAPLVKFAAGPHVVASLVLIALVDQRYLVLGLSMIQLTFAAIAMMAVALYLTFF